MHRAYQKCVLNVSACSWLVLVREPDQLGVERAYPQLAFGVRLVELAEPNRNVAADDERTPASLDDDHLRAFDEALTASLEAQGVRG
jgi:hypothetical protein